MATEPNAASSIRAAPSSVRTAPSSIPVSARLSRQARRRQLITAAMPLAARAGLTDLALDAVSARAGVTRNLLYHYFPRGRADLVIAVVTEAERQLNLAGAGQGDPLARMLDHALAPTHAWRIHRWAAAHADPEIRRPAAQTEEALVLRLSSIHLATRDPDPLVRTALRGYVAFAETALDAGRAAGLPRAPLARLLSDALPAILATARR